MVVTVDPATRRLDVLVHEVRSPAAALGVISAAIADVDADRAERRELVRLAISACRGIERVLADASVASVRLEDVDVARLVGDVVATAVLGGARVEERTAADVPRVVGDPLRLRQAFDNLVTNALVHGGPERTVVVTAESYAGEVRVSVSDSGPGIPLGDQAHIFETGVRLDEERPGAGLGLSVAQAIVEAHGGRLVVTSAPGEGATFTVTLPARSSHPAARASTR